MSAVIPVLNKTYIDTSSAIVGLTTTVKPIFESKEFTIQGNKAFRLTFQLPYTPTQLNYHYWAGVYYASSIKVNSTWYDLGNSGYANAMALGLGKVRSERYYDSKYIDLIGDNIVPADTDYTIVVRLRGQMYGSHGDVNSTANHINQGAGSGNRGIGIQEVIDQNWTSIMIQEKDR